MDDLTRLAHAARTREPGALDAFIAASHVEVWRLCAALVDEQSADDLTQETFVRAVHAVRRFRGDASARTWILAIARNACFDELRVRVRRRRADAAHDAVAGVAGVVADPAEVLAVRDLLAQLEPDRRAAFALTQLLRMTYAEAAVVCDCPVGTIRSHVARARAELVDLLSDAGDHRSGEQHS